MDRLISQFEVMNTKLKPCPFCGTKAKMMRKPLWEGSHGYQGCYSFKVTCEKCGCTLNYVYADTIYRTEDEAINNVINAWNERKNETTVTLKPKTGHWKRRIVDGGYNADWKCSECGYKVYTDFVNYNFCPNCGAKMVEPQESEEV